MAAPTFVTSATVSSWASTGTSKATSSTVAVQTGDLLVVAAAGQNATGSALSAATISTDGSVGSWTSAAYTDLDGAGGWPDTRIWTATVTGAGNVTVTVSSVGGTAYWGFVVTVWRGHGGVGTSDDANSGSGQPTTSLTVSANSAIVAVAADSQAYTGTQTWAQINSTNATSDGGYPGDGAYYGASVVHWVDAGAAGSKTVTQSAPVGDMTWQLIALEILAGSDAPTPLTITAVTNLIG